MSKNKKKKSELCSTNLHEWDRIKWRKVRTHARGNRAFVEGLILEAVCSKCPATIENGRIVGKADEEA